MARYILKRLVSMVCVLLAMIVFIFTLMYFVPGDPATIMLGESATPEAVEAIHQQFGLDDPYIVQLGRYIGNLLTGDMGISYRSRNNVFGELMARFPTTLTLTFGATVLGTLIGIVAGIVSAVKQYSVLDRVLTLFSLFGVSAPSFWLAMMLVLVFSIELQWLPATGSYGAVYWILPIFTLGLQCSAGIMRMTRSSMLEVIRQDYVRTARAKGQTEFQVIVRHALKNALLPILTIVGIEMCGYISGSVLVETVFALPGIGKYILDSVSFKDKPVVLGGVILICFCCNLITFIVDLLYAFVDPRIKASYSAKGKSRAIARAERDALSRREEMKKHG